MNKEYVLQYAELERKNWWFKVRKKIIAAAIKKNCNPLPYNTAVLNVGAAAGASSQWLSQFGKVTSVENDKDFVAFLKEAKEDVQESGAEQLPFANNQFDLVCAFDVIEHIEDDNKAVHEMLRVCRAGGFLVVTVPAFQSLWSSHDAVNHHKRRYTKKSLLTLIEKMDCEVKYATYFNSLLFLPVWIFRKVKNIFSKPSQKLVADFAYTSNGSIVSFILEKIFALEIFLLRFLRFPFGVSLLLVLQKKKRQDNYN